MRNAKFKMQSRRFLICFFILAFCAASIKAQSTSQDFPTPVTTNEISGRIAARDIGDSRSTSYFYTFNGVQGDVFVNVEATNLNGDIDIFTAGNLRPLTKIPLYAGDTTVETGRVIYLRKPEKLILRVEGRTPNDNPATFRIKFAGSFVAVQGAETEEPKLPEIKPDDRSGIRVNSVGTIIEIKPKPKPQPKETVADTESKQEKRGEEKPAEEKSTETEEKKSSEVIVTDETAKIETETPVKTPPRRAARRNPPRTSRAKPQPKKETAETAENTEETKPVETAPKTTAPRTRRARGKQPPKEPTPDPLASVNLIVLFKDGTKIERPMNEVLRVSVDKGTLTIIFKDGKIERHSILDVAKFTIE
jgi:hypothetical protein